MTDSANAVPLLQLNDVHKSFGENAVLRGISMTIAKSEIVCIIGPSGSGKSTILRCINALVPIDSGSIRVGNIEVNDPRLDRVALRRRVGMVFQNYNLFPHRTVLQNIMTSGRMARLRAIATRCCWPPESSAG